MFIPSPTKFTKFKYGANALVSVLLCHMDISHVAQTQQSRTIFKSIWCEHCSIIRICRRETGCFAAFQRVTLNYPYRQQMLDVTSHRAHNKRLYAKCMHHQDRRIQANNRFPTQIMTTTWFPSLQSSFWGQCLVKLLISKSTTIPTGLLTQLSIKWYYWPKYNCLDIREQRHLRKIRIFQTIFSAFESIIYRRYMGGSINKHLRFFSVFSTVLRSVMIVITCTGHR
jgi:hypothetical protein